jgi:serine O-acetyltransferase
MAARPDIGVLRAAPERGVATSRGEETATLTQLIRRDYDRHGRAATNPAFLALVVYRYGRWAARRENPVARRFARKLYGALNLVSANLFKIWVPSEVTVGDAFHIIHAEGSLSIHPDVVIGDRLGVMHNVTIGTNMGEGVPTIGDDVFIGVNSTVLGRIRIGDRVRIAANTAVTADVPSDSVVVGSPARIYPRLGPFKGHGE